ncbi:MAG: DUF6797 domain-containing protein [Planctomycetota bacterium]
MRDWIYLMRHLLVIACLVAPLFGAVVAYEGEFGGGRAESMDYGPFLSMTLNQGNEQSGRDKGTMKATVVRFGKSDNSICFAYDTELMRVSQAWAGGFIDFKGIALNGDHGCQPKARGTTYFTTKATPGWGIDGNFSDPRPGKVGSLPHDWMTYKGLYRSGRDVVLSYSVGDCDILELPRGNRVYDLGVIEFARVFNLGPSKKTLSVLACEVDFGNPEVIRNGEASNCADCSSVRVPGNTLSMTYQTVGAPNGSSWETVNGRVIVKIPPHDAPLLFTLRCIAARDGTRCGATDSLPRDLTPLTKGSAPIWTEEVTTRGTIGQGPGAYVVDTITSPDSNPWGSWMRFAGIDFFADGKRAALCTWSGDVWIVSGLDLRLEKLTWKRFAAGLYQPLGLKIVDEKIYCTCRDQIVKLHDVNNDGEADYYENFNNDCIVMPNYHEFTLDLQTDKDGNFYYAKSCGPVEGGYDKPSIHSGCFLKLSKDGKKLEIIARGLRAPTGLAIGPNGEMTSSDNEGYWMPECPINEIKPGYFLGITPAADPSKPTPTKRDPPICWLPWSVDNSSGGQLFVNSKQWGPFENEMLHMSYGKSALFHVMTERINGQIQGGVSKFPLQFQSGILRGKFNPVDGQLYVCGLKAWQTNAANDGTFQRVRYTGKNVNLPAKFHITKTGVEIVFTDAVDKEDATDVSNYSAWWWMIKWGPSSGSARFSPTNSGGRWDSSAVENPGESIEIRSAKVSDDGKTVRLEIPGLKPVDNMIIRFKIKAADGTRISQEICNTINVMP